MKSRLFKTILLAIVIVSGVWILANREKIRNPGDVINLVKERFSISQIGFSLQSDQWPGESPESAKQPAQYVTNVIRIASFKLNPAISNHHSDSEIDRLADICRRYDAVALQDVAGDDNWLAKLTDRMNVVERSVSPERPPTSRRPSDYVSVSSRSNARPDTLEVTAQTAILFNRRTLELGQSQWYNVNDPDGLFRAEPLVLCFRTRGPSVNQAFTFSLVNVSIDGDQSGRELEHLGELFRAVRDDGRGEDDILIAGDFRDGRYLQPILDQSGLKSVVSSISRPVPKMTDHVVYNELATVEFTGRGGVFDFMRYYNMGLDEAHGISEHMPVWAEFSVFEGAVESALPNQSSLTGLWLDSVSNCLVLPTSISAIFEEQ